MTAMAAILGLFWHAHRRSFLLGLALAATATAAGAALLGLAGWFITASAAAGIAGIGQSFDFFRPSAGIRLLAIVRAAGRYGERIVTHDATLRFLAALRVRLFRGLAARPIAGLARLRRATLLHRLTADVDALDSVYLRLLAPLTSAAAVLGLAALVLGWLVSWPMAAWIAGMPAIAGALAIAAGIRFGRAHAARRTLALEAVRVRLVDLTRGLTDLAMAGRLADQRARIARADAAAATAGARIDRIDRRLAAMLQMSGTATAAGALAIGALTGLPAEKVALGVFAALALSEAVGPLRRGALEAGRAALAARRIAPSLEAPAEKPAQTGSASPRSLEFQGVGFTRPGAVAAVIETFDLSLAAGEWVALTGPSGAGKSTILALAAAIEHPTAGAVLLGGSPLADWPEPLLRHAVALLPQRPELFTGTIAANLRLADPDATDDAQWQALETVALDEVVRAAGGLGVRLGEGGSGLSGGESRRLALARLLLRRPAVALLDEPTEGLDADTARRVLAGLRRSLAGSAVLAASHRIEELAAADRSVAVPRRRDADRGMRQ